MKMIEIHRDTEAFVFLMASFNNPQIEKVSIDIRKDGIAIKRNEEMWTPTLSAESTQEQMTRTARHCGHSNCSQRKTCIYY